MKTHKEALTLALEMVQNKMYAHAEMYLKEALAQPEHEKERCVGCDACIDTACGRDECPKGWPKAAQPEQEPVGEAYLCDRCQTPFDGAYECPSCGHNEATKEPVYTNQPTQQSCSQRSANEHGEPVVFLANGARFKLTFDAKGRVSSLWHNMQELDGRWVALVAADDDCHLKLTTPPQRKPLDIKTIKRIATYCGEHITDEDVIEITRRVEEEHKIKE